MMRLVLLRLVLLLVLLAGCQVFSPVPQPPPSLPQDYRQPGGAIDLQDAWWREFHSPELDALMDEALTVAPDIRAALARLDQASAMAAKTGSALWPTLDANGDATKAWTKTTGRGVVKAEDHALGLAASYELDLWGRVRALRQADRLAAEATAEDLRAAALSLSGEIVEAWIDLRSTRLQLAVLKRQQRTNADILSTLELRFANSLSSALDVLEQREAMADTQTKIAPLQAETTRLENRLGLLLGKAPGRVELSASTDLPAPLPLPRTGLPADLLEARPDIRAAWLRLAEAGWDVAAARADRLPALRLSGKFEQSGTEVGRIFDNWLASLAASLTAPLFDGGARTAEVRRQDAVRREHLATYEKTVHTALSEVDTAVQAVLRQQDLLDALDAQFLAAEAALDSAHTRYLNGVVSYDTVLSLRLKHQQLERTRIQAQSALLTLQSGLCRALGKGWRSAFPDPFPTSEPTPS